MNLRLLSHQATAYFQAVLSVIFIVGYFFVFTQFLYGHVKVPGEHHDAVQVMLGVLTAAVTSILQFWFSRTRMSADGQKPEHP